MITSLVTGGAGFVGSHVVKHLLSMGHKVLVLDNLSGGRIANLPPRTWDAQHNANCTLVEGSILDLNLIDGLFQRYQFDYVFHLAAFASEGLSHNVRNFTYATNLMGSANIINASINYGVKRLVFTSSIAVYGHGQPPFNEDDELQPCDPYGISKYAVEMDLKAARQFFGLPYTIFRPHNIYGPGQNMNVLHRNVVAIFMRQCLLGQPMTLFGDGAQVRAWSYIDDVAPYIARCVDMPQAVNHTYNIGGSGAACSVAALAGMVAESLGVPLRIVNLPSRSEVKEATAVHREFRRHFGEDADHHVSLTDGLKRMADWARTQELRAPEPFAEIEITKNLPESWAKLYEH